MSVKHLLLPSAAVVAVAVLGSIAEAQCPLNELFKFTADDTAVNDEFGSGLDLQGDTALAGARFDDDNGTNSGSAYVFEREGSTWVQSAKLTALDGAAGDEFGRSVSLSGETLLIGAPMADDPGPSAGAAYVFERSGTEWTQVQKLVPSDAAGGDTFGFSVSLSGEFALVGAFQDDDGGDGSGAAYVFERAPSGWVECAKLTASDGSAGDGFGVAVALDQDVAVIGAYHDDVAGTDSGSAYVFEFEGGSWIEVGKLIGGNSGSTDEFGRSVAVFGAVVLVGAFQHDGVGLDSGAAYVFEREGGAWMESALLTSSDLAAGDEFGRRVAIFNDIALIGALRDSNSAGSAYVFRRSGSAWTESGKLVASDATGGDDLGFTLAVSDKLALVGARDEDQAGADAGSAYMFSIVDCDGDDLVDACEIALDASLDCDGNLVLDACEIAGDAGLDFNRNGILDSCECLASTYCVTTPNSTGFFARIDFDGLPSLLANDFSLTANGLPPGQFGVFFFGPLQVEIPFGDGYRCVGGPLTRLDRPEQFDDQGLVARPLDFSRAPLDGLVAGETTNFQLWYRDPQPVGFGFNLTNALEVTVCP